ncbi:MAG TPA: hypothetical protein DHV48_12840 [Prolixibacteraceae bacterium]|nr:hypothetical protein [Prolixibacteraceae bacterium]
MDKRTNNLPSNEFEKAFFKGIKNVAKKYSVIYPYQGEDPGLYDPKSGSEYLAEKSDDFLFEIQGNYAKFKFLGSHQEYLTRIKTEIIGLFEVLPLPYGEAKYFYEDLMFFSNRILTRLNALESEKEPTEPEARQVSNLSTLPTIEEVKREALTDVLAQHGFFRLDKIKTLSEEKQMGIVELLMKEGTPYRTALFEYLGFFKTLEPLHFSTKTETNKNLAEWFWLSPDSQEFKKNRESLCKKPPEGNNNNKQKKYRAYEFKEKAEKDFQTIKNGGSPSCSP